MANEKSLNYSHNILNHYIFYEIPHPLLPRINFMKFLTHYILNHFLYQILIPYIFRRSIIISVVYYQSPKLVFGAAKKKKLRASVSSIVKVDANPRRVSVRRETSCHRWDFVLSLPASSSWLTSRRVCISGDKGLSIMFWLADESMHVFGNWMRKKHCCMDHGGMEGWRVTYHAYKLEHAWIHGSLW
jgi:hypothetical protein